MIKMAWCITCAVEENPDWEEKGILKHKKVTFVQYLKCKLAGHKCYIW